MPIDAPTELRSFRVYAGRILGLLLLGLFYGQPSLALDPVPGFPLAGHWPYGSVYTAETYVDADEELLYYGEGTMLRILNVSNPANMVLIGKVNVDNPIWHIDVSANGNRVAITSRNPTVTLVDVTNRAAPVVLDTYHIDENRLGYGAAFVNANLLAVAVSPAGLWLLDLANPGNISLEGSYIELGTDFVFDVEILGDYAFLADDDDGLTAINIANPAVPVFASRFAAANLASHISLYGNRAYVSRRSQGVHIIDLNVGVSPPTYASVGVVDVTDFPSGFGLVYRTEVAANGLLVMADGIFGNGLVLADVESPASPANPDIVGFNDRRAQSVAMIDNTVFTVYPSDLPSLDLRAYNVDAVTPPALLGARQVHGETRDVSLDGTRLTIANGGGGVVLLDVSNPASPVTSAWIDVPSADSAVTVGSTLVISDTNSSLKVLNISNPGSPVALPNYALSEPGAYSVNLYKRPATNSIIIANSMGVEQVDFSNPNAPDSEMLWEAAADPYTRRVDISGNLMAAAGGSNIWLVNITNPASPSLHSSFTQPQTIEDIDLDGSRLYIAGGSNGMRIRNVTNPASTSELGSFTPLFGFAHGVLALGNTAYSTSDTLYGMFVLNVTNAASIGETALIETPGSARKMTGNNDYLVLSDFDMGVRIWGKQVVTVGGVFADGFEEP